MLAAIFMMDVGRAEGIVWTKPVIRSCPALSFGQWRFGVAGVLWWAWRLDAFGNAVISKAEGDWRRPETGSLRVDGKAALLAVGLYALIVFF